MSFRFETILKLRRHERDEVGREVSQALEAMSKIEDQIADVNRQLVEADQHRRDVDLRKVESVLAAGRYQIQLKADLGQLFQTQNQLQIEVDRRTDRLRAAEAEVKKFEHLRELALAEEKQRLDRRAQMEIDEFNSRKSKEALP